MLLFCEIENDVVKRCTEVAYGFAKKHLGDRWSGSDTRDLDIVVTLGPLNLPNLESAGAVRSAGPAQQHEGKVIGKLVGAR